MGRGGDESPHGDRMAFLRFLVCLVRPSVLDLEMGTQMAFIHSFIPKYRLSATCQGGIVLGTRNSTLNTVSAIVPTITREMRLSSHILE
jgi:hypothetical protein